MRMSGGVGSKSLLGWAQGHTDPRDVRMSPHPPSSKGIVLSRIGVMSTGKGGGAGECK